MGCGSSSTQVKEFRPVSRQHSLTFKKTENHNNQAAHTANREKSEISYKSKKSSSTRSSTVSVSERVKSGKSRSSSATLDRKVTEIENTKSGKSSKSSSAISDRKDKSIDGTKSGNLSRFSSAKSDGKEKENTNIEKSSRSNSAISDKQDKSIDGNNSENLSRFSSAKSDSKEKETTYIEKLSRSNSAISDKQDKGIDGNKSGDLSRFSSAKSDCKEKEITYIEKLSRSNSGISDRQDKGIDGNKSGDSSRFSSAKSDCKEKEITYIEKLSRSNSAISDKQDKGIDGNKSGDSSRFSSAKSDGKEKEITYIEKLSRSNSGISDRQDKGIDGNKSWNSSKESGDADLFGETSATTCDGPNVTVSKPLEESEYVKDEIHESEYEEVNNNAVQYEDRSSARTNSGEVNKEEEEYDEFAGLKLPHITVPEINKNKEFPVYTYDEIVNHNAENEEAEREKEETDSPYREGRMEKNWFLYGRKVYSLDLFMPIVVDRVQEYMFMDGVDTWSAEDILKGLTGFGSYPVYVARNNGVRRKEMDKILPACQIGTVLNISREEYLSRLKQSVDEVKSDLEAEEDLTDYLADYLEQLSRWISSYPNVELEQPVGRTNVDPNQCEFPLPDKIRADCTVIRQWARDWVEFDLKIDEDGAWTVIPFLNEDWGDVHQTFVDICSKREDVELPAMNMEIAGKTAWDVIQLDIVKNDETTEQQEETWKAREKRKDLNDPERMRRRRKEILDSFLKRHDTRLKAEDMVEYGEWADRLEKHWKEFQKLCETFVPRQHVSDPVDLEPKKLAEDQDHVEQETNDTPIQLPDNFPPQDTMSTRSDHGLN